MNYKKAKYILIVVAIIMTLSIFSFGFSSFIIEKNQSTNNIDVDFNYGGVIDAGKYLELNSEKGNNHSGIEPIKYNSKGFVNDETITYDGWLKFFIKFNSNIYYNDYGLNKISFSAVLKYSNSFITSFSLLTSTCFNSLASFVNYVETDNGSNYNELVPQKIESSNFNVSDTEKNITLSFDYNFDSNMFNEKKYTYFEIIYCFSVDSTNFDNIYLNELNLNNNKAKYELSMEIV